MLNAMYLQQPVFLALIAILGLAIGSFLNVIIYRLPIMLQKNWQAQCITILNLPHTETVATETFNLLLPRSHCIACKKPLRAIHNIPLLSFIFLRGKCNFCKQKISWRYPGIELGCSLLSLCVAWQFGISWQTAAALLLTWGLICLLWIDFDHQLLPDDITQPLLWLGLLANVAKLFTQSSEAIIGATVGYLSLWSVTALFKLLTGKIGMGNGDFKLLAVFGAWLGWKILPFIIFFSSFLGAIVGILLIVTKGHNRHTPIPFGPYLAIAGWVALLWGKPITQAYWDLIIISAI